MTITTGAELPRSSQSGPRLRRADDLPDVLNRPQVSEYTGISLPTLARWAAESKGPKFRKAGSRVIYRKADVLAWIDSLEESQ